MNKLLIGTNLKMYKGIRETSEYLLSLHELTQELINRITLFVIPSFTTLYHARKIISDGSILLGAQNMHPMEYGQFTGEISPIMLSELGMDIIEIGHSERRQNFRETDEEENAKVLSALAHNFIALLCVGETLDQKNYGVADEAINIQIKKGLYGVNPNDINKVWIAYEPVWAIGINGTPPEPDYVSERHLTIKRTLQNLFPDTINIPVIFGGSVNQENACQLLSLDNVDGLFIGRSAWDSQQFVKIINNVLPVWEEKYE